MKQVFEAYIEECVLRKALKQFRAAAKNGIEAIGLLAGEAGVWEGREFAVITDYLAGKNKSTAATTRLEREGIAEIAAQLSENKNDGKIIVGWIHSHPGYGCFMSAADEAAQRAFFTEKFSVAIVVDPLSGEKKVFKLDENGCAREASYAVIARKRG
ncbi:MAG: Mov34/MPN/PAD-1 family protein [Candidatus Norongarragalinales archaeon]